MGGWESTAEEAVMKGNFPETEERLGGLGLGRPVYRCTRNSGPGSKSSSVCIRCLVSTYAGVGRGPHQLHGVGRGALEKNFEGYGGYKAFGEVPDGLLRV